MYPASQGDQDENWNAQDDRKKLNRCAETNHVYKPANNSVHPFLLFYPDLIGFLTSGGRMIKSARSRKTTIIKETGGTRKKSAPITQLPETQPATIPIRIGSPKRMSSSFNLICLVQRIRGTQRNMTMK